MNSFKVALVALDGQVVPQWVFSEFEAKGVKFVAHECIGTEELSRWAGDADIVWVFGYNQCLHGQMLPEELSIISRCGAILRTGSGTDNVPVKAATQLGIVVANTPDAISDAVSDHAIGLLFAVIRQIPVQDSHVRNKRWDRQNGFPRWHLRGQTLGLLGFGRIAQAVAKKLAGFEMTILTTDPFASPEALGRLSVQAVSLDELMARSDFVSVHCPLNAETRHLVGAAQLNRMKPQSILINTSRGPVIDEEALISALRSKRIAGAGLDVLESEPPDWKNPLFGLENVVITPHIAGYSDEHLENSWRLSVETALNLFNGRWPRSCVNPEVKPRWNLVR